jgi:hypothetical protein
VLKELETALTARLLPMQDDGFRVLGAPTDHQQVGRVFGKGEIRVVYQSRTYRHEGDRIQRKTRIYPCTLVFEVVVELQDVQMSTHGVAAEAMEAIVNLIAGFNPGAGCGSGFWPVKDGFVGRDKETAVWIYAATFGLERTISIEQKGAAA